MLIKSKSVAGSWGLIHPSILRSPATPSSLGKVFRFSLIISKFTPVPYLCAITSKDRGVTPQICANRGYRDSQAVTHPHHPRSAPSHAAPSSSEGRYGAGGCGPRDAPVPGMLCPPWWSCAELCCPPVPAGHPPPAAGPGARRRGDFFGGRGRSTGEDARVGCTQARCQSPRLAFRELPEELTPVGRLTQR